MTSISGYHNFKTFPIMNLVPRDVMLTNILNRLKIHQIGQVTQINHSFHLVCREHIKLRNTKSRSISLFNSRQTIQVFIDDDLEWLFESFLRKRVYTKLVFFGPNRKVQKFFSTDRCFSFKPSNLEFELYECILIHVKSEINGVCNDLEGQTVYCWCDECGLIERDDNFTYCEKCFDNFCDMCDTMVKCTKCQFSMCQDCAKESKVDEQGYYCSDCIRL